MGGPIACNVDAVPILNYTGGIVTAKSAQTDHTISVVGWNTDAKEGLYWIVRNSWGEYWGNQGYFYVKSGALLWSKIAVRGPCQKTSPLQRSIISSTVSKMVPIASLHPRQRLLSKR